MHKAPPVDPTFVFKTKSTFRIDLDLPYGAGRGRRFTIQTCGDVILYGTLPSGVKIV